MYELMLVATVDKGDQLLGRVEKLIKGADAKDYKVERIGKKPLAYQIKKQTDANFYVLNFDVEGSAIGELSAKLRLEQEDLLRYMLLKKIEKKPGKKVRRAAVQKTEEEESTGETKPKVTVAVKSVAKVKSGEKKVSSPSAPSFTKVSDGKKATGDKQVSKEKKAKSTRFASEARREKGKSKK